MLDDRTSAEYQQWRQDVRHRDGNTCRRCGFDTNLEVHHIKPLVKYPEFATELDNGLTLCGNCHSLLKGKEEITDLLKFIEESPYSRDEQIVERLVATMAEQLTALNDKFTDLKRNKTAVLIGDDAFTEPKHIQAEMLRLEAEEKLREAERLRQEADAAVKKRQREAEEKRQREAEQERQHEAKKQQRRKIGDKLRATKQQTSIRDFQRGEDEQLSDNGASTQAKRKKNLGKPKSSHTKHRKQINKTGTRQKTNVIGRSAFRREVGSNRSKAKAARRQRANTTDRKQAPIALRQLELRAKKDDAAAQYNLGWRYEYGEGVVQDKQEAAKWYRKAAEQGYLAAQNKLAKQH